MLAYPPRTARLGSPSTRISADNPRVLILDVGCGRLPQPTDFRLKIDVFERGRKMRIEATQSHLRLGARPDSFQARNGVAVTRDQDRFTLFDRTQQLARSRLKRSDTHFLHGIHPLVITLVLDYKTL